MAVRFDVYDDDRYYYDMLCSDPTLEDEVKAFYFNHEILMPLKGALDCVVKEGRISVDSSILTNEFRLSVGSLVDILKSLSPKCRRMMLERIKCPSGAYSDLESGFILVDADALQRATDKVDLTDDFKRISFLWTLAFSDIRDKNLSAASLDEKFFDVLLLANNRNFDEKFQDVLSESFQIEDDSAEIVFAVAKRLIKDCYWDNIGCFTSKEQSIGHF